MIFLRRLVYNRVNLTRKLHATHATHATHVSMFSIDVIVYSMVRCIFYV